MPKKKGKRSNKRKRGDNEKREVENYEQKLKSSDKEVSEISINSILHDELLEQILVYLPTASIIRARLVCKKWREITSSTRFLWNASQTVSQKPWFFKFIASGNKSNRYVYDPVFQKWQGRDFLDMIESYMFCDSSDGVVCYMKDNAIHVCNPITREHKMLQEAPRLIEGGSNFLINISVNLRAHKYNVSLLRCGFSGELSVQIYDSETMKWATSHTEILTGWKIRYKKSVICNRVLYFLMDRPTDDDSHEHRLLAYDFSGNSSTHGTLLNSFIPLPCSNICCLINLKGKLIIVAAIGSGRPWYLNNGFIIWLLKGKDWQEISRVTRTCFYGKDQLFGLSYSGADDLIYIHADYDPRLVVFDLNLKQWKDCEKCPRKDVLKGFCLLPRLISP
ncbi:unnamed protein product [Rhodiola kirilowii]